MLDEYIKLIDSELEKGPELDSKVVDMVIEAFKSKKEKVINLQKRYEGDTPIFERDPSKAQKDFETDATLVVRVDDKVNNRLGNAFDADIVDTKTGYLFGKPISYDVNKTNVDGLDDTDTSSELAAERLKEVTSNFNLRNNIADKDSELGKQSTISGYAARLLSVGVDGEPQINNIKADSAIIMSETGELSNPKYAFRTYPSIEFVNQAGGISKVMYEYAEFYTNLNYSVYRRIKDTGTFSLYASKELHLFNGCPLFGVENNSELMGDAEKVISLIDSYDGTLSDISSEITSQRLAYMVFRGFELSDEERAELHKNGAFNLFDKDDDVSYLTKDVNNSMAENQLKTIAKNIMRFAKTVNFDDEAFAGTTTGVALGYKLIALENKCITSQRKFEASLRYQYKLLCEYWEFAQKNVNKDDYLKLRFGFKRSLPEDVEKSISMVITGGGRISNETLLTVSGLVADADEELGKVAQEDTERADSVYKVSQTT